LLYNARSFVYFLFWFTNLIIYIKIWQIRNKKWSGSGARPTLTLTGGKDRSGKK
jgi:hypothetical protein